jgi:hypothetical protein
MKVIKHTPLAPPPPPSTYDLLDLTETEMRHLHMLLGKHPASSPNLELYQTIDKELKP